MVRPTSLVYGRRRAAARPGGWRPVFGTSGREDPMDGTILLIAMVVAVVAVVVVISVLRGERGRAEAGLRITQLVEAQRTEHQAVQAANRQLAQRAATIEQLAESRERNRLARELHDTIAHALSGLSVQLQALGTLMQHDPHAARAQLRQAQATARNGVAESRRAIQALRATPLEDLGLSEALRQLCHRQAERTGAEIVQDIADGVVLDPLTEQSVYRVAEAALTNVEDHAAATHVFLRLHQDGKNLTLEIKDDGLGFDPDEVASDRFGLAGMRERAELLGAELRLDSTPGKGTSVTLRV